MGHGIKFDALILTNAQTSVTDVMADNTTVTTGRVG
jgi:hypothetical protein